MNLTTTREGIAIAFDALRANKVRAVLTTLGIVIGVATVMTMAGAIGGFRSMVMESFEAIGPKNFVVTRFDQTQIRISDGTGKPPWEGKPAITTEEAALIAALPSVRSVAASVDANGEVRYGARAVTNVALLGRSASWTDYSRGDFLQGRNFLPTDDARGASVVVLSPDLAEQLFEGRGSAVGRMVRIRGEQFRVLGVYEFKDNIFAQAQKNWAVVPPSAALRRLGADRDWLSLLVVPREDVTQEQAMDDVTAALRTARGLRPGQENDFALTKQEAFKALFDRLTGVFFLVMLVLASIGLLVGGVGVVGIMMISVTERTREIGVRKALGATAREILWQFLVESMTVTVIGGALGLLVASVLAWVIRRATPVPAAIPLWAIAASLLVSGLGGILFGLYPAFRAARLDPVEALRYE